MPGPVAKRGCRIRSSEILVSYVVYSCRHRGSVLAFLSADPRGEKPLDLYMTILPVIARELRRAARIPFTYYLRTLGVAATLVASVLFGLEQGFGPKLGGRLFAS